MREGLIVASGRPDELGGRDLRPAEIRFTLPDGVALGDLPTVPAVDVSLTDGRVLIQTKEPVVGAQRITTWALDRGLELEHFAVTQPTLEDIYLELTGSQEDPRAAEEVPA